MTIQIPDKLKQENIRFILVQPRDKRPFEIAWILNDIEWEQQDDKSWKNKKTGKLYIIPKTKETYKGDIHSYKYNDPKLLDWLRKDGNYGCCGGNGLMLVDFDNAEVEAKALKLLPETFSVLTGSKRLHLYFFTNGDESFKGFDSEMNTLFDAQCSGKQCICANSIHPNGNKYEVFKDVEIAFIEYKKLRELLSSYDNKPIKEKQDTKRFVKVGPASDDDFLDELKEKVPPEKVLNYLGIDTSSNPCGCPMHESKGGHCLGFNEETAHCFHCEGSWNSFTLLREAKKWSFKEALEELVKLGGMETEYEKNKKKYLADMKEKQDVFIEEEKKKDSSAAENREGDYDAGKINVAMVGTGKDFNGNTIDPVHDDAVKKLMRKWAPKKYSSKPSGISREAPSINKINLSKDEKLKGRIKIGKEEDPYK